MFPKRSPFSNRHYNFLSLAPPPTKPCCRQAQARWFWFKPRTRPRAPQDTRLFSPSLCATLMTPSSACCRRAPTWTGRSSILTRARCCIAPLLPLEDGLTPLTGCRVSRALRAHGRTGGGAMNLGSIRYGELQSILLVGPFLLCYLLHRHSGHRVSATNVQHGLY